MTRKRLLHDLSGLIMLLFLAPSQAQPLPQLPDDDNQLVHAIYKELIETNTTHSIGDNTLAAKKISRWLRAAGFPE